MFKRVLFSVSVAALTTGFVPYDELRTVTASYYATGKITANGEPFNPEGLTAAHRSYPFGTMLRVVNKANNRVVVVRINDRGPYIDGRSLDLTIGAAAQLGMIEDGLASVVITPIK